MCECRYVATAMDVEAVFSSLYRTYSYSPHGLTRCATVPSGVGSPRLRKVRARERGRGSMEGGERERRKRESEREREGGEGEESEGGRVRDVCAV